ncbi:MAG: cell division protein FtsZ [candidate division WS6 bacterium 34_10]|jgi:cell division protein FtsZ|uniref:Cell division protein FtsZ n=1 Tax=candidate division WS6 bacterium 34_10 TaxID=1641389 RepID=A0A101HHF0_9BACT|nr:MAG: cell division protein FtsZ [candidate division WS6 bacterium 34_10]
MLVTTSADNVVNIKVIGIGGGGCNAINTMISDYDIPGVDFMAFNTDAQSLKQSLAPTTLQLGEELTKGLGVGGNHELGAQAAEESLDQIQEMIEGANMVFLTAGMGGGTGTGAAPIIAGVAKNMGALTVAVVTKPFDFEGSRRKEVAEEGLAALRDKVDTLIVIPNQRLLEIVDETVSFIDAMKMVDSVLAEGVSSISNLISQTGYINADFNDAKSVMQNAGTALMGIGRASGEGRAEKAARLATTSPLLDMSIEGATGVLYNIVGSNLSLTEISMVSELIKEAVDPSANIKFGAQISDDLEDEIVITIVATGISKTDQMYSTSQEEDFSRESSSVSHGFTGFTSPGMEKQLKDDEEEEKSTGGLEFTISEDEEEDEDEVEQDDDSDTSPPFDLDSKDPLDVPAFMRKKK